MVARLNTTLAALLGATSLVGWAGELPDPTRPPATLRSGATIGEANPTGTLQLQSVLLGRGRTPAAVISGELVLLGGAVRDARLVRVNERSAVLRGPQGETTLDLLTLASMPPAPAASRAEPTR